MEIIARRLSLLSFRNAQENYSRSASSIHLLYTENHRDWSFYSSVIPRIEINFSFSHIFLLRYIFLRVIPIDLVAGTFSMACTIEYFIRKHSWPEIAVTLAETSTLLWTPFYGEWIVYFQARNRGRSRATPVSILAFRLVPYFATLVVQRSV